MQSNVHIVQNSNVSSVQTTSPSLHNGSIVKARVIEQTGPQSFAVSIAGQKVNVTSALPLVKGAVFDARIIVQNNQVMLKVLQQKEEGGLTFLNTKLFESKNPELENLLNKFGLPVIPESLKLLQFALNMGIKPLPDKLGRAFKNGLEKNKFSQEKAQTALLLDEKGITVTQEAVEAVTQSFGGHSGGQSSSKQDEKKKETESESIRTEDSRAESISSEDVKEFIKSADEASLVNKTGLLTLFNSVMSKVTEKPHWLILPFEWDYDNYSGVIRVLFSENKKEVQKIILNCHNESKSIIFVLYLKGEKLESVKAAFKGVFEGSSSDKIQKKLESYFEGTQVSTVDFEELEGFAVEDSDIGVFKGEA